MTPYWIHLRRGRRRRGLPVPGGIIDNPDDLRSSRGDGYPGRDDVATTTVVGEVQRLLKSQWGAGGLEADGVYGPLTQQAVAAFQRANGLSPTGNVDSATSDALQNSDSVAIGGTPVKAASSSKAPLIIGALVLAAGGAAALAAHKKKKKAAA